jgi:CHAD domain-containing protein
MAKAKRVKGINCNAPAGEGIRLVLQTRFEEMYSLPKAAMNWGDPEGVHSMRVASRRLRSALRDFTPYLRKSGVRASQKEIRRIADTLGDVRDQDVAIMALEKTASKAPSEAVGAVEHFIASKKVLRDVARANLKSALRKDQLRGLRSRFISAVEVASPAPKNAHSATAANNVTYLRMARSVILDRLRELEKLSDSLYRPFKVAPLHDMRIAAKRLRYAIELFQSCWGRSIKSHAKRVARLQTALGGLHDCDVWVESIGEDMLKAKKLKQVDHAAGSEWLMNHFLRQRNRYLRQAFDLWREWEDDAVSDKLREALHAEPPVRKSRSDTKELTEPQVQGSEALAAAP